MKFMTKAEIASAIAMEKSRIDSAEGAIEELEAEVPFTFDFRNAKEQDLVYLHYKDRSDQYREALLYCRGDGWWYLMPMNSMRNEAVIKITYDHIRPMYLENSEITVLEISSVRTWKVHYEVEE